jgi:hypothetical protein
MAASGGSAACQRGDRRAQRRVGRQHSVVAVAMPAWRWDQGSETLDQFERGKHAGRSGDGGIARAHREGRHTLSAVAGEVGLRYCA